MKDLDDPALLGSIDKSGMLRLVASFPDLLIEGLEHGWAVEPRELGKAPSNVLIVGYGGSAIAGDILRNWLSRKSTVPVEVCRDLELPAYTSKETLAICVSYSGETAESLRLLEASIKGGCNVVAITSGGFMSELCRKLNLPLITVRAGLPPRAALPFLLSSSTMALTTFNVVGDVRNEIIETAKELRVQANNLTPSVNSQLNQSKRLAQELVNTMPTIYSLERMSSVARRFKDQLNENSKIPAKFDLVPEACHNEIQGWSPEWLSRQPSSGFPVILVRDSRESDLESSRIETIKEQLMSAGLRHIHEIRTQAKTELGRLLLPINLGDFVSVYLALARGLDPTPVPSIEELKRKVESRTHEKSRLKSSLLS
jgi:glucose/mannose-6-phosphate isomerase